MEKHVQHTETVPLRRLFPGQVGIVSVMAVDPGVKKRLTDLGLGPGTAVCLRFVSPAGDPAVYEFNGTWAALRRRDAERILVIHSAAGWEED